MCGITAIFGNYKEKEDFVKTSLDKIQHRGTSIFEYKIFSNGALGANRLPIVDKDKCTACGACVKECPKGLFKLVPKDKHIHVLCSSKDPAKIVIKVCKVGCTACKLCEKACKFDAIHVTDNLAEIDYTKCTECGMCVKACPRKIIFDERKAS